MASGAGAEWRANWPVVLSSAIATTMTITYLYSTGIVIPGIEREFGWTRAEISSGSMIIAVVGVVLAPFVGRMVDRVGPRRVGLIGAPLFFLALAAISATSSSIWMWWALWGLLAFAATMVTPSVWTTAISGLFFKSRGLAFAMALTGSGLGSIAVPILASEFNAIGGWRFVYLGMAGLWALVTLPLLFFCFHGARDQLRRGRLNNATLVADAAIGVSVREAMFSARFVKIAVGSSAITVAVLAGVANLVPILSGQGIDPLVAARVAGLVGVGSVTGRFLGGYLLDRINGNLVAGVIVALPIVSTLLLLGMPGSIGAAIIAALIIGLSVGVEYDAVAYLTARHFGVASFGTLFGTITGMLVLMGGIGPTLSSAIYDATRSYTPALWAMIPLCALSSILFLTLGPYPALDADAGDVALEEVGARPA